MKIVVYNLGCKVNQYECDSIVKALRDRGYEVSGNLVDADGNIIENEAFIVRNVIETDEISGNEVIYSGIFVKNMTGSTDDYIKMYYEIERLDNGYYQICFPSTCNMPNEEGGYETAIGQLMEDVQNIQSEWFPEDDGECIVTLALELYTKGGGFPPTYTHKAWGPTITLNFVKGGGPEPGIPGDVNGDSEVNIADVNAVIDMILTQNISMAGDVNGDNEVNIADVNAVIDLILN